MSLSATLDPTRAAAPDMSGWRGHLIALGVAVAAILLLFARDAADMLSIWWNASTYGHCLFLPLLIGWLVHQRLPGLRALEPTGWWPGLIWLGGGATLWLMGEAAGVALFRHAGLVVMFQGTVIAMLGPNVARGLAFPLFYAFFMIPFGEEMVPTLQLLTARMATGLLGIAGIPAHLEGIFITTPGGYFRVAEACSGAKFVIAMAAYGALVCNVGFRTWGRRIAFMIGALSLSVLANGVRAFATIAVAEYTDINAAAGFDHVVYGWVFFALVMIAVMAIAWRFFDRGPNDAWFDLADLQRPVKGRARVAYVAPAALALAALAPLWSAFATARSDPLPATIDLPAIKGWHRVGGHVAHEWSPNYVGADHSVQGRFMNDRGQVVDLAIAVYGRQAEGRELVGFGQGAANAAQDWSWSSPAPAPVFGLGEQITAPGPVIRHAVTFYSLGGTVTGSAGTVKLETLKDRLLRRDQRAVAIIVSAEERTGQQADPAITAFLAALGPVKDLADASAGIR